MSYHFCVGPSGSGKTRWLHEQMIRQATASLQRLVETSSGRSWENYVLVVPDQYSLQTQKELVEETSCHGIINIDVQSFGRLTHKIFEEVGVERRAVLDDIGKTLLLRRVAGQCEKDLHVLGGKIHRTGMIAEVKSILSEFMQYKVEEQDIAEMAAFAGRSGQGALQARLTDLKVLYSAFREGERDRFLTTEETLDLLAEAIPHSDMVRRSVFVFDGFTGFTPVQYRVLTALIANAREVWISLTMGLDGGPDLTEVIKTMSAGREEALFYLSRKTIRDIVSFSQREGLPHGEDKIMREVPRFSANPVMAHLEKSMFRYPVSACGSPSEGRLRLFETDIPEEEVRQICIEIHRKVMEEGYEYRDFAVVTGDLQTYGELFEKMASLYEIPVYVDQTSAVMLNPLTEAVSSALQIGAQNFSYEAVFRYLRSGMSDVTRQETDTLENYCLEHGIRGRGKWSLPFDMEREPIRVKFLREIAPITGSLLRRDTQDKEEATSFFEWDSEAAREGNSTEIPKSKNDKRDFDRRPRTAADRTKALYTFMVNCGMEQKMEVMTNRFHAEGDLVREKQYSQLYRRVIDLLEQLYDLLGQEKISARDYQEVLEAGISEIRLGTLPQQVDRVLVGDIERTRLTRMKVLFLAGVNDGNIPHGTSRGGLLSDLEREFLIASGTQLAPTPRQQMYLQRLYLYMNMTKPADGLYLSWARSSTDGKSLRPSYLVQTLQNLFPDQQIGHPQRAQIISQLVGERDSISWLAGTLRRYAEGLCDEQNGETDTVLTVYGSLRREGSPRTLQRLESLRAAAFSRYHPVRISTVTAQKLYGDTIMGGVSRMEVGAKCFLRQFLQYGLRLQERKEYLWVPADAGTVLHNSLERFSRLLSERSLNWRTFDEQTGRALAAQALEETAASYHDLILYSSHRSEYQMRRMQRTLERTVDTLQYQLSRGNFAPAAFEMAFGPGGDEDAIVFRLDDRHRLRLVGRIDRLDLCEENGKLYVKILDYKSGANQLEEKQMRRGLQLQLLLYMDAILEIERKKWTGREVVPAAMLYYQMIDPVLDAAEGTAPVLPGKEVEQRIRQKLRPTGMVNSAEDSLRMLDRTLVDRSDVIPVSLKKDGTPKTGSTVYTTALFAELSETVQAKVCSLALEILAGNTAANPAQIDSNRTACDYCPFRNVCGFDRRIPGYHFRED